MRVILYSIYVRKDCILHRLRLFPWRYALVERWLGGGLDVESVNLVEVYGVSNKKEKGLGKRLFITNVYNRGGY